MRPDLIVIELGDGYARIHIAQHTAGAPAERTRIPLRPVALSAEGEVLTGRAAIDRAAEDPGSALTDLLERMGDPSPCRLGGRSLSAEDLLTGALARPLSAWEEGEVEGAELHLLLPAHWGPHVRDRVTEAFARVVPADVRTVQTPIAVAQGTRPALPEGAERLLVVDAGADRIALTALTRAPGDVTTPWLIEETAAARIGLEDVDDALLGFVLARTPLSPEERSRHAMRTGCRSARSALQTAPATTLTVPGREDAFRLVRGDLEVLVGETLRSELERTIGRLGSLGPEGSHADPTVPVLVVGEFAGQPLLVETVSSLLRRPVQVAEDPEFAALDAAVQWAADGDAADDSGDQDPDERWTAAVQPSRRSRWERRRLATFPHLAPAADEPETPEEPSDAEQSSAADPAFSPSRSATGPADRAPLVAAATTTSPDAQVGAERQVGVDGQAVVLPGGGMRSLVLTMAIAVLLIAVITWIVLVDPLSPLLDALATAAAAPGPVPPAGAS